MGKPSCSGTSGRCGSHPTFEVNRRKPPIGVQSERPSAGCTLSDSTWIPGRDILDCEIYRFRPLRPMPPAFDSWLPLITEARAKTIETISRIASTRRVTVGVTHNDIFPGNVLVNGGQVTALLDWEEADIDWLVWDLASSISPFCSTPDGDLDMSATQDFLDAYRAASGRVPPEEDDFIVPLL
jgi:Phosphotransferase enzyme family